MGWKLGELSMGTISAIPASFATSSPLRVRISRLIGVALGHLLRWIGMTQ